MGVGATAPSPLGPGLGGRGVRHTDTSPWLEENPAHWPNHQPNAKWKENRQVGDTQELWPAHSRASKIHGGGGGGGNAQKLCPRLENNHDREGEKRRETKPETRTVRRGLARGWGGGEQGKRAHHCPPHPLVGTPSTGRSPTHPPSNPPPPPPPATELSDETPAEGAPWRSER